MAFCSEFVVNFVGFLHDTEGTSFASVPSSSALPGQGVSKQRTKISSEMI